MFLLQQMRSFTFTSVLGKKKKTSPVTASLLGQAFILRDVKSVFNHVRYQPEQPSLVYQMANTQEEVEQGDNISTPSMGILPGVEERLSFNTLLFPNNPEPSTLSGFTVNVCASLLGGCSYSVRR